MPDSTETDPAPQQNYIGGKWGNAVGGKTFRRYSPYDQSLVGVYQDSDEADAANAVEAELERNPLLDNTNADGEAPPSPATLLPATILWA